MNYLTQYYKNLSEQLQARVNHLQEQIQLLNEIGDTPSPKNLTPNNFDGPDVDNTGSTEEVVAGHNLADMIATHHANIAPHIKGKMGMDVAASKADILKHLTRKGAEPVTSKNFVKILKDMEEHGSFAPYSISAPSGEPDRAKYNKIIDDVRVSILDAMSEEA